jgi:hypothetical protein
MTDDQESRPEAAPSFAGRVNVGDLAVCQRFTAENAEAWHR